MDPVSKKGDLAQAGRKKLDDFRRKKAEAAAAKAKGRAASSSRADGIKKKIQSEARVSLAPTEVGFETQASARDASGSKEGTISEAEREPDCESSRQSAASTSLLDERASNSSQNGSYTSNGNVLEKGSGPHITLPSALTGAKSESEREARKKSAFEDALTGSKNVNNGVVSGAAAPETLSMGPSRTAVESGVSSQRHTQHPQTAGFDSSAHGKNTGLLQERSNVARGEGKHPGEEQLANTSAKSSGPSSTRSEVSSQSSVGAENGRSDLAAVKPGDGPGKAYQARSTEQVAESRQAGLSGVRVSEEGGNASRLPSTRRGDQQDSGAGNSNGGLDRGGPTSSVGSSSDPPSRVLQDAPSEDPASAPRPKAPEVPTTIPFLSPSLPSPSPSPHKSPSPPQDPQTATERPTSSMFTPQPSLPPWLATPAQAPPRTAPAAAGFPPSNRDPPRDSESVPSELDRPPAAPSSVQTRPVLSLRPTMPERAIVSVISDGKASLGLTPVSSNQRLGPENNATAQPQRQAPQAPAPSLTSNQAVPVESVADFQGGVLNRTARPVSSTEGSQGTPMTLGEGNREQPEALGQISARLTAVGIVPDIETARRRLDFAVENRLEGAEAGLDNSAGPAVPRVQSQPSFKDYIPDDLEPPPTEQRSRTPDLLSTTAEQRSLAQTASSLRSSFASLFAPSARPPTLFPRPRSEEDFKRQAEEAPEANVGVSEGSVVGDTRSPQTSQAAQTFQSSQLASVALPMPPILPGLPPPTFRPSANTIPLAVQSTSTATTARYPRSPFIPVTTNPVETSKPPPTKPVETTNLPSTKLVEPPKPPSAKPAETSKPSQTKLAPPAKPVPSKSAAALRESSVEEGPKADSSDGLVSKPANPPIWSRPRPQNATIDLNPSASATPSFTFPSSQRDPPQPNGAAHASSLGLGFQPPVPQSAVTKPKGSKPQVSNPKGSKSEEEGVVVGPRRDQARSPRRRPKSPVPEPRSSPATGVPLTSENNPPALRPVSTWPSQPRGSLSTVHAPDRRRSSSSSNTSLHSNGDEKTEGAENGSLNPDSDGLPQRDTLRLNPSDGPLAATSATASAKPSVKPLAKRSLLQSALAPPVPKSSFRSSFTSTSEAEATSRETDAETPPSQRAFTLPPAEPASFDPTSSSRRSLGVENGREGSSRLLRLPSMPTVNEATLSPERDRADGGDFASLEQHIEDLTQEKFALQRGAEAARALAASLEEENSRLTEDFNWQAQAVQALKVELERQQAEITAQQVVAEAMTEERERLQRENAGALEQAQVMGREVVHLEEQVLKLRSSELRLRKELEGMQGGYDLARRQLTTLAADRASLRQMMDALQEERRLLVARLRQLGDKTALEDVRNQLRTGDVILERSDATTSTDDLPGPSRIEPLLAAQTAPNQATDSQLDTRTDSSPTAHTGSQNGTAEGRPVEAPGPPQVLTPLQTPGQHRPPQLLTHTVSSAERVAAAVAAAVLAVQNSPTPSRLGRSASSGVNGALPVPTGIPEDQSRVIENVNRLMNEISAERRAMAAALAAETEACEELRISNSELSRKLAVVSERLRMSESGDHVEGPSSTVGNASEIPRVDEGDEVVERVLGWISRFFAGKQGAA